MSGTRPKRRTYKTTINLPNIKLPSVSIPTNNPPGWNRTEITVRTRGWSGALDLRQPEPAGDPPGWWTGTRPEWAVYWGLNRNGKFAEHGDFLYRAMMPAVGTSYFSTTDFYLPLDDIAIEVQGEYWHYGQGSDKQFHDKQRLIFFKANNIDLIFIDEEDALEDPKYYVEEALARRDHSKVRRTL